MDLVCSRLGNHRDKRATVAKCGGGPGLLDLELLNTPEKLISRVKPTVLVKGSDYKREDVVGHAIVEALGGEVILIDLVPGHSTSAMVERTRAPKPR